MEAFERQGNIAEGLRDKVETLRLGHGLDDDTDVGPLRAERFREKVERHVADAGQRGARVVTGGERPTDRDRGYFYRPTVLVDVDNDMAIMQEETFGPTIPIMAYDDIDDAIAWVNSHPMGLGATLRSHDPVTIKRFFEEVKVGTVWINDPLTDNLAGPFGGMKLSGGARELGEEASRRSSRASMSPGTSARTVRTGGIRTERSTSQRGAPVRTNPQKSHVTDDTRFTPALAHPSRSAMWA